jgi:hypothetical protein
MAPDRLSHRAQMTVSIPDAIVKKFTNTQYLPSPGGSWCGVAATPRRRKFIGASSATRHPGHLPSSLFDKSNKTFGFEIEPFRSESKPFGFDIKTSCLESKPNGLQQNQTVLNQNQIAPKQNQTDLKQHQMF